MIRRFIDKFNHIHEFIITSFFVWTIMTLCASFLILQLQLVKYFKPSFQQPLSFHFIYNSIEFLPNQNLLFLILFLFSSLQKSDNVLDTIELTMALILQFWSLLMIFFFCILGEMVTNQFEMFNDELNQCNWYVLPLELQKIMIIVMVNAQRETVIRGFGNILCTRQTFKKVERFFLSTKSILFVTFIYFC